MTRTNECSICLCRTIRVVILYGLSRYPYQKQRMCSFSTHGLNTSLLLFFILHIVYTFDVCLMDFCMFTLGTILYKKLMPVK